MTHVGDVVVVCPSCMGLVEGSEHVLPLHPCKCIPAPSRDELQHFFSGFSKDEAVEMSEPSMNRKARRALKARNKRRRRIGGAA